MTTTAIQNLETRLRSMVDKTFMVNTICYKVMNYSIQEEHVLIGTDKKVFSIDRANAFKAIEMFLPADPEPQFHSPPAKVEMQSLAGTSELRDILMDNIRKVREDKTFIPQAQAVSDSVKTIIELAKTEIQMHETLFKINNSFK